MKTCRLTMQADRVEPGPFVPGAPNSASFQTLRLFQGDECVCVVTLVWPGDVKCFGSLDITQGREAGERD